LEILYFDKLHSTQKYLIKQIKTGAINGEIAIVAKEQTQGIGSRNSSWISKKGDLTLSFAIKKNSLTEDLPTLSASIYFAFFFKEILHEIDKECWLKWPNDIYKKNKKIAGLITQPIKDYFVVGIGLNLIKKDNEFGYLDTKINVNKMLNSYFMLLKKREKWQEVLKKFRVEFEKQKSLKVHIKGKLKTLKYAKLCDDGALLVENERIYSLRWVK